MKEQINSLSVNLSALWGCTNVVNDFTSCAPADDEFLGTNAAECRDKGSEMVTRAARIVEKSRCRREF